jgi:hypothetical protein
LFPLQILAARIRPLRRTGYPTQITTSDVAWTRLWPVNVKGAVRWSGGTHRAYVMRALSARNRVQVVVWVVLRGLYPPRC